MTAQTATQALNLAWSYVLETDRALSDVEPPDIPAISHRALETLSLAARQLDNAAQLDPTATVEVPDSDGVVMTPTQHEVRAQILCLEGRALQMQGNNKKAIKVLEQAIKHNPNLSAAYSEIAYAYIEVGHKDLALQNAKKALELQPDDLDYLKLVDRLSAASAAGLNIAGFKGSWKLLLALVGFGLFALFHGIAQLNDGALLVSLLTFGIAFVYWRWRR